MSRLRVWVVLGAVGLVALVVWSVIAENRAIRECEAGGGTWTKTGEILILQPVKIGGVTYYQQHWVPQYECARRASPRSAEP